jgi:inositol-hexakisphosphate/diphosphoinositol-pentakisphosphate 1-kinase
VQQLNISFHRDLAARVRTCRSTQVANWYDNTRACYSFFNVCSNVTPVSSLPFVVDGKVERDANGKEVRFPVILNYREKEIARRIVLVFKQYVCGFDILRIQEENSVGTKVLVVGYYVYALLVQFPIERLLSFTFVFLAVCDVNGWSFVKNSRKYYDDCAQILGEHILALKKPDALRAFSTLDPLVTTSLNRESGKALAEAARMLRDQTPKRAMPHNTKEILTSAATLLREGAKPVREFPATMTSEPASISQSGSSSVGADDARDVHEEELRCVIAIVRHGDRTPKQKLKVNTCEERVLRYFHSR